MEIVMTTPHGDADIRVTNQRASTTLAEIVVAATGQAAPAVVRVDGRTLEASTTLGRAGLRRGSVIDTVAAVAATESVTLATLAQIAGPGAGRRHPLGSGRHRLGPGRRVNATELSSAPVEEPVVTIDVDLDGSVTLHPIDGHRLTLGGSPVDGPVPWSDEHAALVDGRAFVVEHGAPTADDSGGLGDDPGPDGRIAFRRRPRTTDATRRRPAIDAVRDATTHAPGLWQRRPADRDGYVLPVGVRASGPPDVVSIDLATHAIVSVAGPQRVSLARTIVLEAVTLHGPADLDIAVATTPAGLEDWDWTKWLPHVHAAGRPAILRDAQEIAAWEGATAAPERPHLTVLVVDDPALWRRRDAPLHDLVTHPTEHLRIVALSAAASDAPPGATILLTEDAGRRWRYVSTSTTARDEPVLPALVEIDVARRAAIAMAALDDQEAPVHITTPRTELHTLRSVVAPTERSAEDTTFAEVRAGAVIVGTDHETARTAAVLAMRRCLAQPCWLLDLLGSPWTAGLDELAGRSDTDLDSGSVDPDRLLARLRHHLGEGSDEVVVLVDADREAGARVMVSATQLDAVTVLGTASTEPVGTSLPIVRVERRDGRRRATIDLGDPGGYSVALDDDPDTGELSVRALVAGRPLTALERRIEREATGRPETFVEQCRELVAEFAGRAVARPPVLARPPLPAPLHIGALFALHPGDGIPIGIVDDPDDDHDALWWQPDQGHLLAIGPGLGGLLGTVSSGLTDRYGDDEVELFDASPVAAGEAAVSTLLEHLDRAERSNPGDGPILVVVVDDLGALRRRSRDITRRLDTAVADGRLALVALGPTLDDVGAVADDPATTLVVAVPGDVRGRCRVAPDGRMVQLAEPDPSLAGAESTGSAS